MRSLRFKPCFTPPLVLMVGLALVSCWDSSLIGNKKNGTPTTNTGCSGLGPSGAPTNATAAVAAVAAGLFHTIALDRDGAVWTWGQNSQGQLGNGTAVDCSTPIRPSGLMGILKKIGGGYNHTIALKSDGTVWTWGNNFSGQLGDGSLNTSSTPIQVPGLTNVIAVAGGESHTIALMGDGTVWSWGNNFYGQLGDNTTTNSTTPVQVKDPMSGPLTGILAVASGGSYSMALKSDRTVLAWGLNGAGQLGNGTVTNSATPVLVIGLSAVIAMAAGENHSIALESDGTVWTWGSNIKGQLGVNGPSGSLIPVPVTDPINVTAVAGGYNHAIALKGDGTVWAWGDNFFGQLGLGTADSNPHSVPAQVTDPNDPSGFLTGASAITGGGSHTISLKSDGTLWAWGENQNGQLGDGTAVGRPTPVQVIGLKLF